MRTTNNFIFEILFQVALALAIFMLIYVFLLQPHQVRGHSMDPNFEDGEYILTDKLSYRLHSPKQGDVIVFSAPPARHDEFIKRVIGTPGENVSVKEGRVFVNKVALEESYIPKDITTSDGLALRDGQIMTLENNEFFVMGDNRLRSSDSRSWGVIKRSDIVGRAWLIYWPINRIRFIPSASYP